MIRRKETLGFIDFLRGKYAVNNKAYIANMVKQMTVEEKQLLATWNFNDLWKRTWQQNSCKMSGEETASRDKFNTLKETGVLTELLNNPDNPVWTEPEWGFPKGRREVGETDLECAIREFKEETGLIPEKFIENLMPFEEIFMGSNYKAYKHKYFVMQMKYTEDVNTIAFDKSEIGEMRWMSFRDCMAALRNYNLERRKILVSLNMVLTKYVILYK